MDPWIIEDTFAKFLEHLVKYTNCSPDHPMLLILDNPEAHVSLRAVDIAKSKYEAHEDKNLNPYT